MKEIKCECGHVNPLGTVLCESCGKPIAENQHIDGNEGKKLLNMRYDGTSRRSKTFNKSFIDRVWSFFSSVKVRGFTNYISYDCFYDWYYIPARNVYTS